MKHLVKYKLFESMSEVEEVTSHVDDIFMYLNEAKDFDVFSGFYGAFGAFFKVKIQKRQKHSIHNEKTFNYNDISNCESKLFNYMNKIGYEFCQISVGQSEHSIDEIFETYDMFTDCIKNYDEFGFIEYEFLSSRKDMIEYHSEVSEAIRIVSVNSDDIQKEVREIFYASEAAKSKSDISVTVKVSSFGTPRYVLDIYSRKYYNYEEIEDFLYKLSYYLTAKYKLYYINIGGIDHTVTCDTNFTHPDVCGRITSFAQFFDFMNGHNREHHLDMEIHRFDLGFGLKDISDD